MAIPEGLFTLFSLSLCSLMQGIIINGLLVSVESTLEKRFDLKSTEVAWLISCFHLIQCVFQPIVAYLGGNSHPPRWIGFGMMGMGVFTIMLSVPHFTTPQYKPNSNVSVLCDGNRETDPDRCEEDSGFRLYLIYFVVIQILNGIMNIPLITLGLVYFSRNCGQNAPTFQGIFLAFATVGGALGYFIGGTSLRIFTELKVKSGIDEYSPLWVGAWWLGLMIVGAVTFLFAIPALFLPSAEEPDQQQSSETLMSSMRKVSRNYAFLLLAMALSLDYGTLSGIIAFLSKYLQTAFNYSAPEANLRIGAIAITGGVLGQVGGGVLVKKYFTTPISIIKYVAVMSAMVVFCSPMFLLYCDQQDLMNTTDETCTYRCHCNYESFLPICGGNDVMYFSPCFAGCMSQNGTTFSNCSCIVDSVRQHAKLGTCSSKKCIEGDVFVVLILVTLFLHMSVFVPTFSACTKLVHKGDQYFAFGILWTLIRLLGMFPFPLIYGFVFQHACRIWSQQCGTETTCRFYDIHKLRLPLLLLLATQKVLNLFLLSMTRMVLGTKVNMSTTGSTASNVSSLPA